MSTRGLRWFIGLTLLLSTTACAEANPEARSAHDENGATEGKKSHDDPDWYDSGSSENNGDKATTDSQSAADSKSGAASGKPSSKKKPKDAGEAPGEPVFKEGMSVNDAINAIPQGYPRVNIDQEDLNAPLMDPEFYKSCKPAHTQHFTIKFAVWEGHAVGMDIKTTPGNKGLEQCLHGLIAGHTWKDKVKSLNISEVQF
jgi:hypothetical protein